MQNPKYEMNKISYLSNDFIRCATALQGLDDFEINLYIYLCYKAKENACEEEDGWIKLIEIDMKKFLDGLDYKQSWSSYSKKKRMCIYKRLIKLQEKSFEIKTKEHRIDVGREDSPCYIYQSYSYVNHIKYSESDGTISVQMNRETQSFLNNCAKNFTPIIFGQVAKLKNKYSKILYMFFRSYRDGLSLNRGVSITVIHLRQLLGLEENYKDWYQFKIYVLLRALREINEKSDIFVYGKKDIYEKGMEGKESGIVSEDEHAEIVLQSMLMKGSYGKKIEKLFFHVISIKKYNDIFRFNKTKESMIEAEDIKTEVPKIEMEEYHKEIQEDNPEEEWEEFNGWDEIVACSEKSIFD